MEEKKKSYGAQKHDGDYLSAVSDSPERIQQCLHCTRPKCVDCYTTLARKKRKCIAVKEGTDSREEFLDAYLACSSDLEIAVTINKAQSTVNRYRTSLSLSPPSKRPAEEKRRLVEAIRNEVRAEEAPRNSA